MKIPLLFTAAIFRCEMCWKSVFIGSVIFPRWYLNLNTKTKYKWKRLFFTYSKHKAMSLEHRCAMSRPASIKHALMSSLRCVCIMWRSPLLSFLQNIICISNRQNLRMVRISIMSISNLQPFCVVWWRYYIVGLRYVMDLDSDFCTMQK